jgi:hypothetical protein
MLDFLSRREFLSILGVVSIATTIPLPKFLGVLTPLTSKVFPFELDERSRLQFVSKINAHYDTFKRSQQLYDFKVLCDDTNNPPHDPVFYTHIYVKKTNSIKVSQYELKIDMLSEKLFKSTKIIEQKLLLF